MDRQNKSSFHSGYNNNTYVLWYQHGRSQSSSRRPRCDTAFDRALPAMPCLRSPSQTCRSTCRRLPPHRPVKSTTFSTHRAQTSPRPKSHGGSFTRKRKHMDTVVGGHCHVNKISRETVFFQHFAFIQVYFRGLTLKRAPGSLDRTHTTCY